MSTPLQSQEKAIGEAGVKDNLTTSVKYSLNHALILKKTSVKLPKLTKILQKTNLVTLEHYYWLNSIIEIKSTGRAPKYRTLLISFEFSVIHVPNC